MTLADRIAVMDKGRILQVAPPAEIYEAPKSRFVADFVGNVNVFEGTVRSATSDRVTIETTGGFDIVAERDVPVEIGQTVSYVLRPEKLKIAAEPLSGANVMEGEVWDIAYFGPVTSFHIRLDTGAIVKVAMVNATRQSPLQLTWHDRAFVTFDEDAGLVLTQ